MDRRTRPDKLDQAPIELDLNRDNLLISKLIVLIDVESIRLRTGFAAIFLRKKRSRISKSCT